MKITYKELTVSDKNHKCMESDQNKHVLGTNMNHNSESDEFVAEFGSIPDIPLMEIYSHLSAKDLVRCSQVNHHWSRVASTHSIWKKRCIDEGLFEEDEVSCDCSLDSFSEKPCLLKSHYANYMIRKRNFRNGTFTIQSILCDMSRILFANSDGKRIIVVAVNEIRIWDIVAKPTLVFSTSKSTNVVKAVIIDDLLFLFSLTVTGGVEQKLAVYQCLPVDHQPIETGEENPDFTYSSRKIRSRGELKLQFLYQKTVSLAFLYGYICSQRIILGCKDCDVIHMIDSRSGVDMFDVTLPKDFSLARGLIRYPHFFYTISGPPPVHTSKVIAFNIEERKQLWETKISPFNANSVFPGVLDVWRRRYITVVASYKMVVLDLKNGNLITEFVYYGESIRPSIPTQVLPRACEDLLRCLERVKKISNHEVFSGDLDYVMSPYGAILCCKNINRLVFITNTGVGKATDLRHFIFRPIHLRDCVKFVSRHRIVMVCPRFGSAHILDF